MEHLVSAKTLFVFKRYDIANACIMPPQSIEGEPFDRSCNIGLRGIQAHEWQKKKYFLHHRWILSTALV